MSDSPIETNPELGQTWISVVLLIAGAISILAAIYAFFTAATFAAGCFFGLCFLAGSAVLISLAAILDLLSGIFQSLRRLESKGCKETDKA